MTCFSLLTNVTWGGSVTGRVGYAWSPDLRLSQITLNGDGIGYGYDLDLLLTNAGQLRLNRDAASGFVTNTVLGEVSDVRQISKFGELQSSASDFGGTNLLSFDYGYDAMWRMTSRVERIQNQTNLYIYSYDAAGRLIEVHTNGSLRAKYQYDANGNRTNAILSGSSLVGHYDAQDRLLGYGATTYQYDDRGTLTNKSVGGVGTAYRYDARGSLLAVSSTVSVIRYSVDPLGRRIAKSVNGTTVQRLVYQDFLKPIAELNADGSVKSRFVYATRVNVPDYMVRSGTTYRIIADHLGSVRLVVDAQTGAVAQRLDYDEWGNVLQDTNPGFQPFGFAGGLYDPDTGLTRFGYRDYDPMTGRWLAKDPILFRAGSPNLYSYCHGDPISYIDPLGLGEDTGKSLNWYQKLLRFFSGLGGVSSSDPFYPVTPATILDALDKNLLNIWERTQKHDATLNELISEPSPASIGVKSRHCTIRQAFWHRSLQVF
ncbi:MAG: RHS repeat-associated core domain-containing protein [Kiritimatiellae bacterium]|nr:RHS repeat-associated core domain-containing protein [Kiritimatiellia bacterium]